MEAETVGNSGFYRYHNQRVLLEQKFSRDSEHICRDFISFCKSHLDIQEKVAVKFLYNRSEDITTGCYIPREKTIHILVKDRGLVDILRSIAHELVHQRQHIRDELKPGSGDTGSEQENEANMLSGILMRKYHERNGDNIY
jgi:hypothetical protein